ncbi:hypothetical protein CYMTET_36656 [Cymbomonas tetramitiformis]|uniref:Uncharacterized protein n=1 Tax=Cymbomonas tetramitiformis TaxID=36881 RepID=A0AAE0CGW9_9CHLO|nr:hypothetical protein CYMTET_36656 [Cymbomonas tetramitiformis]
MNVMFAAELAQREAKMGSRITAYSVHPGPTASVGGVRYELPKRYQQRLSMTSEQLAKQARQLNIKTTAEAAQAPLWLASVPGSWPGGGAANGAFYLSTPPYTETVYEGPIGWRTKQNATDLWNLSLSLTLPSDTAQDESTM